MISRWPIRIRLTAAFTAMMALDLTGVAIGTLVTFGAAFDESLDRTLTSRLQQLQATESASGPQSADTAAQVLDAGTGAILSGSPTLEGRPLLSRLRSPPGQPVGSTSTGTRPLGCPAQSASLLDRSAALAHPPRWQW